MIAVGAAMLLALRAGFDWHVNGFDWYFLYWTLQFLVSLEERVQCYRRCVPMAECKKDMITEQLYCNRNEQLAVGNSKLVGCALVCCQWCAKRALIGAKEP
jgi:hypothetical protein